MTKGAHKFWQLFQREVRPDWRVRSHAIYEPEPEPIFGGTRLQAWADGQLRAMGFNPAIVRKPAPVQRQQTGGHTPIPPTPRDTGEQAQLPPLHNPLYDSRALAEVDTAQPLPGLPRWVLDKIPQGLPVLRDPEMAEPPIHDEPAPLTRQIPADAEDLDTMLATLPYSNHAEYVHPLRVVDLPDHIRAIIERERERKASQPLQPPHGAYPDIPTVVWSEAKQRMAVEALPVPDESETWLNSAILPALVHDPNAPASGDKSNVFAVTEADMKPDLSDEVEPTQASALIKLRYCEHKKESE